MEGRISRKQFWLGVLGLIVAGIILSLILSVVGLGVMANMGAAAAGGDPAAVAAAISSSMRSAAWGSVIMFVIFAYPGYALSIKRRHDKDNSGLDVKIYYVLGIVILLLEALGIGMTIIDAGNGIQIPAPSMPLTILGFLIGIFGIYLLVVLGFLRGTAGPNQYGPDPVGMMATA